MKSYLLLVLLLTVVCEVRSAEFAAQVDLDGDGTAERVALKVKSNGEGKPATLSVSTGEQTLTLHEFTEPDPATPFELKAVRPGDGKRQWLQITSVGDNDFVELVFVSLANGKLRESGSLYGQGEVTVPGNGTVVQKVWMGFWTRVLKHEIRADDSLAQLKPELYAVGVKGKVTKSFELRLSRTEPGVLARPRVGSDVEVLVCARDESKGGADDDGSDDWYLIKTETGFAGWVQMKTLQEGQALELPWAG